MMPSGQQPPSAAPTNTSYGANPLARPGQQGAQPQTGSGFFGQGSGQNPLAPQTLPNQGMGGMTKPLQVSGPGANPQTGSGIIYDAQGRPTFQSSGPVPLSGVTAGMLGLTQNGSGQYTNAQGGVAGTVQGAAGNQQPNPGQLAPPKQTAPSVLPPGQAGTSGVDANGQISGIPPAPLGQVQTNVNTSNVPPLVGGDALSAQMTAAQQAAYKQATGYLDPQFANQENSLRNQLVNQGIPQNSDAWNKAMDDFNRQKTFAYQQAQDAAVQQGNAAQAQTFGEGLSANQNQFGQNLTSGTFANSAQSQQVQQIMQALGFNEGVNQNNFNNSMGMRQQDLNELLLQQQNPLSILAQLQQGNGVQQPQFPQTPGTSVGGTDIASIISQFMAQQNNGYNAAVGNVNSQNSGTASIAAAVIAGLLSDRRLKKNVRMIGMHEVGVPLYAFDYMWDKPGIGVMADELENVLPDAVFTTPSGYKAVDYAKLSRVA